MGRIIIFTEFYYPELLSTGYFITEIAEFLAQKSEVIVICPSAKIESTKEIHNRVSIIRIPTANLNKNNLLQRTFKFLKTTNNLLNAGKRLLKSDDQVICLTNPAFLILGISKLKSKIGFNLTILVHDVFPENLIGSGILVFKGLIFNLLLNRYNNAYKRSDRIIVIGRDMKDIFKRKLIGFRGVLIQIPNWGDSEKIYPSNRGVKNVLNNLKIGNSLIFQFAGNIGRTQGIEYIVKASEQLVKYNINFVFFGEGVLKDYIEHQSIKNNRIVYGGSFLRGEANIYLNACDIALVSLLPGMRGLGVPSKTYNIMAAGKPILFIGPANSEIGSMVLEEKIGWVVNSGLVRDIVTTIKGIYQMEPEEIKMIGRTARKVLIRKYSKKIIMHQYDTIFNFKYEQIRGSSISLKT
ncbi:MAG: glycosyltransferase family 4 protein [Bacteroidales bacterium]|nr:glycosyltransferase family 4 protein [Bacteroidales bacterium]